MMTGKQLLNFESTMLLSGSLTAERKSLCSFTMSATLYQLTWSDIPARLKSPSAITLCLILNALSLANGNVLYVVVICIATCQQVCTILSIP